MIVVNLIPQTILTHEFFPRILKRKEKLAIINFASVTAAQLFTCLPIYSPTKLFNDFFSKFIVDKHKK